LEKNKDIIDWSYFLYNPGIFELDTNSMKLQIKDLAKACFHSKRVQ